MQSLTRCSCFKALVAAEPKRWYANVMAVLAAMMMMVVPVVAATPAQAAATTLCTGYAGCANAGYGNAGYAVANQTRFWGMVAGHNCTNYAAFRLIKNGIDAGYLQGRGMAHQWGDVAKSRGVVVDSTPRVGDIAWWAANQGGASSAGHVGYVEQVGNGFIITSEDNYNGDFHWVKRTRGSNYPTAFIHFAGGSSPSRGTTGSPTGALDHVSQNGTGVRFRGWAIDPDTSAPIAVHAYVTPQHGVATTAEISRPDVAAAFPGSGDRHGFDVTRGGIVAGQYSVCAYAINVPGTPGQNTLLACRSITLTQSPIGVLDNVTQEGSGVRFRGWAIDPDISASIEVHAYVTPQHGVATTGDIPRPDVAAIFPASGDQHGFDVTRGGILPGTYNVCAYGINAPGTAGGNTLLGCRTFALR